MKLVRFIVCALAACAQTATPTPLHTAAPAASVAPAAVERRPVTLTIIGTNDVHGALQRLPLFGGYMANLRAARAADGGGVVLLDGGDMFQGTLESNVSEGADIVRAYNALGYAAVAVGNHEFDYGPAGPAATARGTSADPRGALKARAQDAKYPFVVSNIADAATGARVDWPNMPPSTLIEVAGVKIGIVGASTESTPYTTMPANFVGLKMLPTAAAIAEQAAALRARGAQVVAAAMHIGTSCRDFTNPDDASSCEQDQELISLIGELPKGTLDVIVAGHTHAGVAHRIGGVAVIESFSSARAFGRIDLTIGADGKLAEARIQPPRALCAGEKPGNPMPLAMCQPGSYEGKPVVADAAIQKIVDEAMEHASARRGEKLGVVLPQTVTRAHGEESAEGNLVCDLMLAARPDAHVAMTNGGGLRTDLPAGELTYGQLFEAMPFDNRFAIIELTGAELRAVVTGNLERAGGFMSWGGLTAKARCTGGRLDVKIRVAGKPLVDTARYKLATSDFLASGGDTAFGKLNLPPNAVQFTDVIIRDAVSDVLRGWKATPKATIEASRLYTATSPRLDYVGQRPVACGKN